ncbi:L,D-transpeptidase family protein [Enterococcus sp. 22-H-5-01]|uniref:L,D-transpeptidase n=1 Tax=Enterococcus sp. 22-H-5-01 TaxID=3418555 RepID=UPI003CFE3393
MNTIKGYGNRRILEVLLIVAGTMSCFLLLYFYYSSHFYQGSTIAGVDVSGLSIEAAAEKIQQETQQVKVQLQSNTYKVGITLNDPYKINKNYLKQAIHNGATGLPLKKKAQQEVLAVIDRTSFPVGKEAQNAKIIYRHEKFEIQPEKSGTVIDSARIRKELACAMQIGELKTTYNLAKYYREAEVTKADLIDRKIIQHLTTILEREIQLKVNTTTVLLNGKMLADSLDGKSEFDPLVIAEWVAELEQEYSTIYKAVHFTNVHGVHLKYKNIGNYGWFIDIQQSAEQIAQALQRKKTKTIQLVLQGDTKNQPLHVKKNYVEVDLDNQKMYCFKNGKLVVETHVITGRYAKGTATVPGFHTIMDKLRNVDLTGVLTTGDGM